MERASFNLVSTPRAGGARGGQTCGAFLETAKIQINSRGAGGGGAESDQRTRWHRVRSVDDRQFSGYSSELMLMVFLSALSNLRDIFRVD